MSTKATVTYGPDYHLYREVGDTRNVYLSVDNGILDIGLDKVTFKIPENIWKEIRQYGLVRNDLSETDLRAKAVQEVEDRLLEFSRTKDKGVLFWLEDEMDSSVDVQIERRFTFLAEEKNKQIEYENYIQILKVNCRTPPFRDEKDPTLIVLELHPLSVSSDGLIIPIGDWEFLRQHQL